MRWRLPQRKPGRGRSNHPDSAPWIYRDCTAGIHDRGQATLFPDRLEDWIGEDHLVRVVEALALATLEAHASPKVRAEMAPHYGIVTDRAMGVPMARMQALARNLGRDHALAAALWASGWYETRTVAALIEEPAAVTSEQMDHWRAEFDNWALTDTVCFKLFDRVPHAFAKVDAWAGLEDTFGRRAAFALLASLALHGRILPSRRTILNSDSRCAPGSAAGQWPAGAKVPRPIPRRKSWSRSP